VNLEHLNPEGLFAPPGGMYSHAVRAGNQLYISGQIARDVAGKLVGEGDVVAQYRHVWASIGMAVRKELAPPKPPASTMLVLPALAIPGALVEVDAIAVFPGN
jgi:enamine deaminase RidA (YjgF/YER057c/UK114 family)